MNDVFRYDVLPLWEAHHSKHFTMSDVILINWAGAQAFTLHINTPSRADGSPYINHPFRMLKIAMGELGVYNKELNITILFHDVPEETKIGVLRDIIGASVELWFGLKSKNNITQLTKTPENKKTYLKDIKESGDWIVILAKLIDRLDNMQTLGGLEPGFQQKQARETREFFLDMCDALARVIPEQYHYVPARIKTRLEALCEQYGC